MHIKYSCSGKIVIVNHCFGVLDHSNSLSCFTVGNWTLKHYLTLIFIDLTPIRRRFFFRRISLCLHHVENIWSDVDIYLLEVKKETCVKGHTKVWEALRNAIMMNHGGGGGAKWTLHY